MNRKLGAAAIAVACMCARGRASHAEENSLERDAGGPARASCADARDAATVVACALAASPEVAEARALVDAAGGRRDTAAVVLPSNPTLAGTISNRRRPDDPRSVPNWSVSLAQEIEIGGQRGARLEVAEAERQAREARLRVATAEVAAGALTAYYEAIAAREALTFATELASTARALADYAEARAHEELVSGVEADVARAEATRIGVIRFEAERHLAETVAVLALLLDVPGTRVALPAALPASASLPGDAGFFADQALRARGELAAAEAEQRVLERRLALVRRERISSPTVSLFAERGEVRDHIFGVGLAVPLPVPAPIGRTRAGEITEAIAQLRAAQSSRELARRRVLTEVARATTTYWAKVGEAALFAPALLARARADLTALRDALAARRLTLREGLPWQRSLIELLSADIDARLAKLTAEVELRRVSGLPLGTASGGGR
jgi:cobalt-zinc-cadmium efflux system outer membrane protein